MVIYNGYILRQFYATTAVKVVEVKDLQLVWDVGTRAQQEPHDIQMSITAGQRQHRVVIGVSCLVHVGT